MEKLLRRLLYILIVTLFGLNPIFVSYANHLDNLNLETSINGVVESKNNSDNTYYTTYGLKSWIIKKGMKAISFVLTKGGDTLEKVFTNLSYNKKQINLIKNQRYEIAEALDSIADNFNFVGVNVKYTIYEQLISLGFSKDVSWLVAGFVDVLMF